MNLTQEELAREIDITVGAISRCERGQSELTLNIRQIKLFANLLERNGISINDLPDSLKNSFAR